MTIPQPKKLLEALAEYYDGEWGFSGTRAGISFAQGMLIRRILNAGHPTVIHHGGAFGADFELHGLWRESKSRASIDVWPADEKRAALYRGQKRVKVHEVTPPLDRNLEIVKRSMFMFTCPHTQQAEQRSGTWHTTRAAFAKNIPVLIVWPNGQMTLRLQQKQLLRVTE